MKNRLREDMIENREREVLSYIDQDIENNPECLTQVSVEFWNKIKDLTEGVEVDLDASIQDDIVFSLCQIAKKEIQDGKGLTDEEVLEN